MFQENLCSINNLELKRVHGSFDTRQNTAAVFLAIWFYNCEFNKIMTTYCHIYSFMTNLHLQWTVNMTVK